MNLIGAMLIMLSCTAAGLMKARSLSELDKTYGTLRLRDTVALAGREKLKITETDLI